MVISRARRAASSIAALAIVAGAAIAVHALALETARAENPALLGPGSKVLLAVLFGFLLLLAFRHLATLVLATSEQWAHACAGREIETAPLVSIIVPAFNEGAMIHAVLESLLAIDYPSFEVLVIDDGSSDETFLRALPFQHRRPEVECRVLAKPNGGKFDALNHGIAQARGEIVVCIDGDSILHCDALKRCVAHFADPRIGAVAGNVRVANRASPWSALQALEYIAGYGLN
jgi:cellulose synthase/poly-beta-1,6-N-acetylglucosamine synthase-like glycosyltransferase